MRAKVFTPICRYCTCVAEICSVLSANEHINTEQNKGKDPQPATQQSRKTAFKPFWERIPHDI